MAWLALSILGHTHKGVGKSKLYKELGAKVCLRAASRPQEHLNSEGWQFEHLRDCT